jgi:hypothetical protein
LALSTEQVTEVERETGFDLRLRPETFSPPDFLRLSRVLKELGDR